jgi:transposase
MSKDYSEGFKANLVRRMTGARPVSARALEAETGVTRGALSRWLRDASNLSDMKQSDDDAAPKSTKQWTAAEQLAVVAEAAAIPAAELGAFLRRKGLRSTDLDAWRALILAALGNGKAEGRRSAADARRVKELEREVDVQGRRLRAVEALLDLQKKVRAIWGDADEVTTPKSAP